MPPTYSTQALPIKHDGDNGEEKGGHHGPVTAPAHVLWALSRLRGQMLVHLPTVVCDAQLGGSKPKSWGRKEEKLP